MEAVLPLVVLILGIAAGTGVTWFVLRNATQVAKDQERILCQADLRVAETQVASKDQAIQELQVAVSKKDQQIELRSRELNERNERMAKLETLILKEREGFQEKLEILNNAEKHFKDTFEALAAKALKENNVEFDKLSKPVRDTLNDISGKIAIVNSSAKDLSTETSKLVKALQKPEVRGQWGEMHLRRVVEVTGMIERCDFHEQQVIGDGEIVQRPDLVIHLPGERHLAIDAKAPIRAFLESADAPDDESRLIHQKAFVTHVRDHIRTLGSKAYHESIDGTPEFVVLYLPTEAIFSAALAFDGELLEYATKYRVHLAGPTVLITLLRAVAHGWKQESLAKHAKEICDLGEELYKRMAAFGGHMSKLGSCLNRSVQAYNQAVGSLESRVMPQARRFEQLGGAPADAQIEELTQIESMTRELQCAEFAVADGTDAEDSQQFFGSPR